MEQLKVCSTCKEVKPLSEFNNNKIRRDGKSERCKKCRAKHRMKPTVKAKQAVHMARFKFRNTAESSQDTLTSHQVGFILSEGYCGYCQEPLAYEDATVDHVIPISRSGANSFDNVVCACKGCNSTKNDRPALLFMLQSCSPHANKRLLERLALRTGTDVTEVYAGLVLDAQAYYEQRAGVTDA
jgi:5-methylcytosine-specific restriction endonuclease McrA